jgi:hypothetical protein
MANVHTASAQTQSVLPPALAGPPSPEHVQPWGLPPPVSDIGPVTLFAEIYDQPQGKFLEGGGFDEAGNFWLGAIGSVWVSYLTPDAKLVPVFNCSPRAPSVMSIPPDANQFGGWQTQVASVL